MLKTSVKTKMNFSFCSNELKCFDWMLKNSACFPVDSKCVKILTTPSQFYDTLIQRFQTAHTRISLASLYLGTGKLEVNLIETVQNTVDKNVNIKFNALLDYQRGTRGDTNSRTILQKLVDEKPNQCSLSMYHTPNLRGLYKALLPPRWNELIGLQHMKVYIADDTVLLTGANCSNDYFTNRQDRYIEIQDKDLSDFYYGLIKTVSDLSIRCKENYVEDRPNLVNKEEYIKTAFDNINYYLNNWTDRQHSQIHTKSTEADTWIFPLVQMGELGIYQDSIVTNEFLSSAPQDSCVRLATGYFNLTDKYANTIINEAKAKFSLLMAHPNANGFLGAAGAAGGIPYAYSLIARKFLENVVQANQTKRIELLEYQRPEWTFHAKGLWFYPPSCVLPWATLIGSPNMGERSVRRDLETQIALFTVSQSLQESLHNECVALHSYAKECSQDLQERSVPLWVRTAVNMFRHFF